jgi:hypothetical protein
MPQAKKLFAVIGLCTLSSVLYSAQTKTAAAKAQAQIVLAKLPGSGTGPVLQDHIIQKKSSFWDFLLGTTETHIQYIGPVDDHGSREWIRSVNYINKKIDLSTLTYKPNPHYNAGIHALDHFLRTGDLVDLRTNNTTSQPELETFPAATVAAQKK